MIFEKFVRPAQSPNIRPPRQSTSRSSAKDAIITFKIDLSGNGTVPQLLTGAFSSTHTRYCEAYVNEVETPP